MWLINLENEFKKNYMSKKKKKKEKLHEEMKVGEMAG